MLFRKNCQNACTNERDGIDEGSKVGEMPHPGGVAKVAWRDEAGEMLRPGARGWRRERGGLPACKRIAAD